MGETRPEPELELKRPLWVIGASGYNLGITVADVAEEMMDYEFVHTTDTEVDVMNQDLLIRHLTKLREKSPYTGIDIAYCAGINLLDAIEDVDEVNLWQTFGVNVMGFIKVLQALVKVYYRDNTDWLKGFASGTHPQIVSNVVAVASDAARVPMRNSITYCASKAALVQAVRVAGRELAPYVRVNAISPGIIDGTPMTTAIDAEVQLQRKWTEEEARAYERSMIPMQRRGTKWEVADLIMLMLNGPAYMTGSNIEINGGK
jgi:NAD(P)-dependent dehydrogenase (short-subunit alcohol dehydrogenase family)